MLHLKEIINNFKSCLDKLKRPSILYYDDNAFTLQMKSYKDLISEAEKIQFKLTEILNIDTSQNYIGIIMESSICIPVIIMACVKAGYPFICIDDKVELDTNKMIIQKLNVSVLFSFSPAKESLPANLNEYKLVEEFELWGYKVLLWVNRPFNNLQEHMCLKEIMYAIKTSGSTGSPKVVKVSEKAIMSNIYHFRSEWNVTSFDIILLASPPTFDPFMVELLLSWLSGAALMIVSPQVKTSSASLLDHVFPSNGSRVTIAQFTPSVFMRWPKSVIQNHILSNNSNLRILALGGEAFPAPEYWNACRAPNNHTQLYNLYGTTELSCWAMINDKLDGSLGHALSHTLLRVQDESGKQVSNGMGELLIGSDIRVCLLDNERLEQMEFPVFRATGDIVAVQDGVYRYIGRTDNVVKRYGHRVSLEQIETLAAQNEAVATACCAHINNKLVLFLCINDGYCFEAAKEEIKQLIIKSLNKASIPDEIIQRDYLPLNRHGKLNRKRIKHIFSGLKSIVSYSSDPNELFVTLWKKYTINDVNRDVGFISAGGNSITAMHIVNTMAEKGHSLPPTILKEMLNNNNLLCCSFLLKSKAKSESVEKKLEGKHVINAEDPKSKRLKIALIGEDIVVKMKGCTNSSLMENIVNPLTINIAWSFDLQKCVDAVPTCISFSDECMIAITGSHAGKLAAIDINNGALLWESVLPDRIESSITPSLDASQGLVGCYDCCVYNINLSSGDILWKFKTQGIVKAIPLFINETWIFGSYDYSVYCVKKTCGSKVWQYKTTGIVSASPILLNNNTCVVVTLSGEVIRICCNSGRPIWSTKLPSPVFSTPCIVQNKLLLVAEVKNVLHGIDPISGSQIWQFITGGNIYSMIVAVEESNTVLFGCHNNQVYCLRCTNQSAEKLWSSDLGSAIYASPCLLTSNLLVAASTAGHVAILDIFTGQSLYSIILPGQIFSSPVVLKKSIVIGCRNNLLYCLSVNKDQ